MSSRNLWCVSVVEKNVLQSEQSPSRFWIFELLFYVSGKIKTGDPASPLTLLDFGCGKNNSHFTQPLPWRFQMIGVVNHCPHHCLPPLECVQEVAPALLVPVSVARCSVSRTVHDVKWLDLLFFPTADSPCLWSTVRTAPGFHPSCSKSGLG